MTSVVAVASFAEFHDELRGVARNLLAPASPLTTGGEPVAPDWRRVAGAGWLGLEVPEALGGAGATPAEVAIVLDEVGRAAAAGPFLGTFLAVSALGMVEPSPARDDLLAAVATGRTVAALVVPTGDAPWDAGGTAASSSRAGAAPAVDTGMTAAFRIERRDGGVRLIGQAAHVPDAPDADRILVVADDPASGRTVLVDAAPGRDVEVRPTPVVDATRNLGEVVADGTPVDPSRCWPLIRDPGELLARGAVAVAVDALGLAQSALDATVAYAGQRHQFGRPIGSFQAVKHACADVAVDLTISRRLVADAVSQLPPLTAAATGAPAASPSAAPGARAAAGEPDTAAVLAAASMAKAHAGEAAVAATGAAVQLHGGIGYTWEHGLHALLKRATLDRSLFGSPAAHRRAVARRYRR